MTRLLRPLWLVVRETVANFVADEALSRGHIASTYVTAGALVVLLVWSYYSAQIFLFGAEFTHAFARLYGTRSASGKIDLKSMS